MTEPTDEPTAQPPVDEAAEPVQSAEPGETGETAEDAEGPRRRARREREERRAAQARATAIEAARREAKRKVMGTPAPQTKTLGRGAVRGLKMLMWTAVIAVVVVGLGLLLYFTPIMSARSIVVVGVGAVTQDEVVAAAQIAPGTPLLQVNTDAVAGRVAGIRRIASARVQRQYPSTLRITVVERVPVVLRDYPDGVHLFDKDGVDFATGPPPPGIPYLDTENPGPGDPATEAALQVMTSLRPDVASQVGRVSAPSVAAITLTLIDGRTVVWGTTDRTEEKALKLAALLTQPGQVYDVSSPDLPTVK
ncbi:cell division protein FtsQ/DivIB [Mycolicibacterium gilvum]|uniref:Cell division protein FtsQ n=1 Tax=Mycolicibacterium gilvum (strain DSM 45189 / LMG 24558 / Spyr1) TaxID=278137 RepID=E6TH28_MYCSR|nr:FtsQ-type POTRA domain-containing protein [Mycolicibacterium gilvum]ADT98968.1 cell division septal protein [Mycolicibacterium gilvum Spyr1]